MDRLIPCPDCPAGRAAGAHLSLFTVDQRQYAMVFQFGEVVRVIKEPGIQFKIPMLQNVRYFDRRIQTIDPVEPELFNTREKKTCWWTALSNGAWWTSSSFTSRWAAMKPLVSRLRQTINDGLRAEFGQKTVTDVISASATK